MSSKPAAEVEIQGEACYRITKKTPWSSLKKCVGCLPRVKTECRFQGNVLRLRDRSISVTDQHRLAHHSQGHWERGLCLHHGFKPHTSKSPWLAHERNTPNVDYGMLHPVMLRLYH